MAVLVPHRAAEVVQGLSRGLQADITADTPVKGQAAEHAKAALASAVGIVVKQILGTVMQCGQAVRVALAKHQAESRTELKVGVEAAITVRTVP